MQIYDLGSRVPIIVLLGLGPRVPWDHGHAWWGTVPAECPCARANLTGPPNIGRLFGLEKGVFGPNSLGPAWQAGL